VNLRLDQAASFGLYFGLFAEFSLAFCRFLWDKSERLDRVAAFCSVLFVFCSLTAFGHIQFSLLYIFLPLLGLFPAPKRRVGKYSRRAFNFYDFWFIFTALVVPVSRVTPINAASFPAICPFPLFPRALLMLLYAAPCVFCCVFNEMFIALYFYSEPQLLLIEWRVL